MYAHKVTKQLDKYLQRNRIDDDIYRSALEILSPAIKRAQKFHLGELSTYKNILNNMKGELFMGENGINVKCPYPEMWIDYNIKEGNPPVGDQEPSSKRGIYICEIFKDTLLCHIVSYADQDKIWLPAFAQHLYLINNKFENRPDVMAFLDNKWSGDAKKEMLETIKTNNYTFISISHLMNQMANEGDKGRDSVFAHLDQDRNELAIINMTLKLLCCKNIISEDIQPIKLVKKKKRIVSMPDKRKATFKVLKLLLPKTRKKRKVNKSTNEHVRVHFCRGHFKTYTKDAPLFGKIIGTFWWQPNVRGTTSEGISLKTYELKPV